MNRNNLHVVYALLNDLESHINDAVFDINTAQGTMNSDFADYELRYIKRKLYEAEDAVKELREGYEKMYSSPANEAKEE